MSRYFSDRPCPHHGSPVERYIRGDRCCTCQIDAVKRSNKKRYDTSAPCPRCGGTDRHTDGRCVKCFEDYVRQRQQMPCPDCGTVGERDRNGRCAACSKPLFGRKVPKEHRSVMITFITAINLQYGVTSGDISWGGVKFDSKNFQSIVNYLVSLKGQS